THSGRPSPPLFLIVTDQYLPSTTASQDAQKPVHCIASASGHRRHVMAEMTAILEAILAGDTSADDYAALQIPASYRAVTVRKDEAGMFDGLESRDKAPRKSLHVDTVPLRAVGRGGALIAFRASAINYNTVWTSILEPVPTFKFLARYGRISDLAQRHDLPYHVVGSDAAGVVLRTGPGVTKWGPGDGVVGH